MSRSVYSRRAEETLSQIEASICARLMKLTGIAEVDARRIAVEVADSIALDFSGELVYFNQSRANRLRDQDIWIKFTGGNYSDLAIEFGLTEMYIREIVSKMRSADRATRQIDMFENDPVPTQK